MVDGSISGQGGLLPQVAALLWLPGYKIVSLVHHIIWHHQEDENQHHNSTTSARLLLQSHPLPPASSNSQNPGAGHTPVLLKTDHP